MREETTHIRIFISHLVELLTFSIIGYFVYGGLDGALAVLVLSILYSITGIMCLVPIAGAAFYPFVMYMCIWPYVASVAGIYATLLTTVVFVVYLVSGIILNGIVTLFIILLSKK